MAIVFFRIEFKGPKIDYIITTKYALSSIYTYIAGNIVALDKFLINFFDFNWGASTFRSFLKWFARFGLFNPEDVQGTHNEFVNIGPFGLNTYTYLRPFYEDFGVYSVLLYSYLWGALSALSIEKIIEKFSLLRLHIATFIFFSIFMSFFNFAFINVTLFLYFGILIWFADNLGLKNYIKPTDVFNI